EKEAEPACHQTGRNSGVIHSGIYYKPGSLKAQNCFRGKQELIAFALEHSIPIQKVGKVILATQASQIPKLRDIEERGRQNNIGRMQRIGPDELRDIEPHATCIEGIWIPDCSILSYAQIAKALVRELQKQGVEFVFGEEVNQIEKDKLSTDKREYPSSFLINCAGVFCDRIAKLALKQEPLPYQIFPFRGEYYSLAESKRDLVKGLIYPVPDPRFPFLGVHLTRRVDGMVEAGPNAVLAMGRLAYTKGEKNWRDCRELVQFPGFWKMCAKYWKAGLYEIARSNSKALFLKDLQTLMPSLTANNLVPGGSGIRAQLVDNQGRLQDDFVILKREGMIHVLNAPSPAATASFSIGQTIAETALQQLIK
ncbi:MAG: L-2-hydroxyglutarate oxidase, partial [Chlamydiia bacterium]|nr:L-2-hydroxyglutarate oxidase [Chlamydiia bacterium]